MSKPTRKKRASEPPYRLRHPWADRTPIPDDATYEEAVIILYWKYVYEVYLRLNGYHQLRND